MRATSILRILSLALLFLAGAPRAAFAQPFVYGGVRWGEPAERVRARFEALGFELLNDDPARLLFSGRDGGDLMAVMDDGGRYVALMRTWTGNAAAVRRQVARMADSLEAEHGPPAEDSDSLLLWQRGGGIVAIKHGGPERPGEPHSAILYLQSPGYNAAAARDEGGAFLPLNPARWALTYDSRTRRTAIDLTRIEPLGNGVYRVWERWDGEEQVDDDGIRYDSALEQVDFDCRTPRTRLVYSSVFLNGREADTGPVEPRWDEVVPESVGEVSYRATCALLQSRR